LILGTLGTHIALRQRRTSKSKSKSKAIPLNRGKTRESQELEVRRLKIVEKRIAYKNQIGFWSNNGKTLQRFTNLCVIFRLLSGFWNFEILGHWNFGTLKH